MSQEFIPIHADPEWQELDRLDQKVFATYRAFRKSEDEVKKLNKYDLPHVLDVTSKYISYDLQLRILTEDQNHLRDELEGFKEDRETTEIYRSWRMEVETAIRNAQEGNYIPLKDWFRNCQKRQEYQVIDLDLQYQLEMIILTIPDNSEPLKTAPIAWQQPEFQHDE